MQANLRRTSVRYLLRLERMNRLAAFLLRLPLALVGEITDRVLGPEDPFEYKYSTTPPTS